MLLPKASPVALTVQVTNTPEMIVLSTSPAVTPETEQRTNLLSHCSSPFDHDTSLQKYTITFCSLHALMRAKLICIITLIPHDGNGNSLISLYLFLTSHINSFPFKWTLIELSLFRWWSLLAFYFFISPIDSLPKLPFKKCQCQQEPVETAFSD